MVLLRHTKVKTRKLKAFKIHSLFNPLHLFEHLRQICIKIIKRFKGIREKHTNTILPIPLRQSMPLPSPPVPITTCDPEDVESLLIKWDNLLPPPPCDLKSK